jgi:hypothetical protein
MPRASNEQSPSLTLPDNSGGGVYCYTGLLGSIGGVVSVLYYSITKAELFILIAIPILLAVAYLLFRSITTSTPGSISINTDSIILTNVPSFRI